jgi:hypothetical protein
MWVTSALLLLSYALSLGDEVFIALQSYQLLATTLICFYCKKYEHSLCEDHDGGAMTNKTPRLSVMVTRGSISRNLKEGNAKAIPWNPRNIKEVSRSISRLLHAAE